MTTDNKTLADVQPGGMVRLGDQALPPEGYAGAWIRSAYGQPSSFTYWNMEVAYAAGWQAALSAQPSPGGQGDALGVAASEMLDLLRSIPEEELLALDCDPHPPSSLSEAAKTLEAALTARQPVALIAQKVGDYRVTVAEDAITVSRGRDIVFAYSAGDAEPINASQPVGEPVAWKYQDKAADGVWEDRIGERLPCWEHRNAVPLYAGSPAQGVALGQFRKAVEAWKRDAQNKYRAGEIFPEQKDAIWKEADRLLALIDSRRWANEK